MGVIILLVGADGPGLVNSIVIRRPMTDRQNQVCDSQETVEIGAAISPLSIRFCVQIAFVGTSEVVFPLAKRVRLVPPLQEIDNGLTNVATVNCPSAGNLGPIARLRHKNHERVRVTTNG